jgi:hypothetical protein
MNTDKLLVLNRHWILKPVARSGKEPRDVKEAGEHDGVDHVRHVDHFQKSGSQRKQMLSDSYAGARQFQRGSAQSEGKPQVVKSS